MTTAEDISLVFMDTVGVKSFRMRENHSWFWR